MADDFKACSVESCNDNAHYKSSGKCGYCSSHYHRFARYGDPLAGAGYRARHDKICSLAGCDRPHEAHSYCRSHYRRWRQYGDPFGGRPIRGEVTRYLNEVVLKHDGNECLVWPYARNGDGYGRVSIHGRMERVNRVVCSRVNGPAPTNEHDAAHSCGRGKQGCVAKRHLSWKTRAENEADKLLHGTHNRGERHGVAKLTEADVLKIRSLSDTLEQSVIADRFGIDQSHVSNIQRGKAWAWLPNADQLDILDDRRIAQ